MSIFKTVIENWRSFSAPERRNIFIYVAGIMLYKFGLEAFNGSIIALATNRYDYEGSTHTLERIGLLTGLNQAFQCIGSVLIAPLVYRFPTAYVLSSAIIVFGLCSTLLLIIDAGTGGKPIPAGWDDSEDFSYYGSYNTDIIIPIYCLSGISYGMVELIRRIIPRDIVGGDVKKLQRMDSLVHIFYEVSGTSAAFFTALVLIPKLGNNFSFVITPVLFFLAAFAWSWIKVDFVAPEEFESYTGSVLAGVKLFLGSIWMGGRLLFTSRRFAWLLPAYSFALYAHRYLENGVAPAIAKRYLGNSAWSQVMVGGSNFGEMFGAMFVFFSSNTISTPIPWLRLDALLLLILWYIPYWRPVKGRVTGAWIAAASFLPVSFGWAAGDVSVAAYIQASLMSGGGGDVSSLSAVMAFLYSTYVITYAITSPLLGRYLDRVFAETGEIGPGLENVLGIQFTLISALIMAATFVPKGARALNPSRMFEQDVVKEKAEAEAEDDDNSVVVVVTNDELKI